ncbi:N-acetylmuramoyl-L-alanine amidase [Clostridium senegalense]|uniref:N-acetylmuramoyl-L-alanine amidase n=1 Tax=Clostridium senegalense TaxID=1465809 RepID=UPI000289F2ED|nr:N-acetylmuramoyl-L-alanine amidase [Clostridium senegalense]
MKIAGRSGHNPLASGADGLVNETTEDRKIFLSSKKYLEKYNTFIDCYPNNMVGISTELMWGINKANNNGAELFYSVHLNKAYTSYNGAIGAEIWLHPIAKQETKSRATAILKNLQTLGFINRGIKYSSELAELNSTTMEAMIIECFFCEATKDVELYNKHGSDKIGLAIANGIDNKINIENENNEVDIMKKIVLYVGDMDAMAGLYVAQKNQCPMMKKSDFESNKFKAETIITIGGKSGSNRYTSLKDAAALV